MPIDNKSLSKISWAIIFLMLWILIGSLLFPHWWYRFFVELRFLDISYWVEGVNDVFRNFFYYIRPGTFILFNIFLPLLLTIIALKIYHKNFKLTLPIINIFNRKYIAWSFVIIVFIGFSIFVSTKEKYENETAKESKPSAEYLKEKFKPPIDFIYIDEKRVYSLYSQISPKLELENRTIEKSIESSAKVQAGNSEVFEAELSGQTTNKKIDKLSSKKINSSLQVIEVLNYFNKNNLLKEYQTLKLSSDALQKLDEFSNVSEQYGIDIDRNNYATVYDRVLKETIFEQQNNFKNISNQILVTGDFTASIKEKKFLMSHDYINISNNRISFTLLPISCSSESIKSNTLKSEEIDNRTMKLNVFGKVIRVDSEVWGLNILFEPYAIW